MENKISRLENYTVQDKAPGSVTEKRCRFYYLENDYLWKEFDVEGHHTLDEAFEIAKDLILDDLIKMALKESIKSLDLKSKHFHFEKDGQIEDLRDYVFDLDILDENTDLYKEYKKLLLDNFNDDMIWYYFRVDAMKNANIHDDNDKKTLYNHYFDDLKEFKSGNSFLEYCGKWNGDYEDSARLRRIHYNFFMFGDYHCIDDSITRKDLYDFALINGYYLQETDILSNLILWELFGYYYGKNNGLNELESISFGLNLTSFFCNGYASTEVFTNSKDNTVVKTDKHFNESSIFFTIENIVYHAIDGDLTDYTREIFYTIFDIYKNRIQDFEKKTKRLEFRVSERQYKQFMALEGKSKADKLSSLLVFPKEEVDGSLLPDISLDDDSLEKWGKSRRADNAKLFPKDEWTQSFKPSLKDKYGEDKEISIINAEGGALSPEEDSLIRDIEEMDKYRAIEEEEELNAFLKEEAEEYFSSDLYKEHLKEEEEEAKEIMKDYIEDLKDE